MHPRAGYPAALYVQSESPVQRMCGGIFIVPELILFLDLLLLFYYNLTRKTTKSTVSQWASFYFSRNGLTYVRLEFMHRRYVYGRKKDYGSRFRRTDKPDT